MFFVPSGSSLLLGCDSLFFFFLKKDYRKLLVLLDCENEGSVIL